MAVQWLGISAFTAVGPSSIPVQGTKILQAVWYSKKKTNKLNKQPTPTKKTDTRFSIKNFNKLL